MSRELDLRGSHEPGFFAWQSAHTLFPGTDLIKSCNARSLRACWRLLSPSDMVALPATIGLGFQGSLTQGAGGCPDSCCLAAKARLDEIFAETRFTRMMPCE